MAHHTPSLVIDAPDERRGDLGYFDHKLAKRGSKIQVYVKVAEFETGIKLDKSKTIGTITTKNSDEILMSAASGYSERPKCQDKCLDTNRWNFIAYHVAKQVDFRFPGNIRDNAGHPILDEHRGRAHAGHVEVLLASWFALSLLREEPDLADKPEETLVSQLKRLKYMTLGDKRTAFITLDSSPCRPCLQFICQLSNYTGISFIPFGPQGIGPVVVRAGGARRQDVVADVFPESGDETMARGEATIMEETVAQQDTTMSDPDPVSVRSTTRPTAQRPRSLWGYKAVRWVPENPDQLLSSYKKKTPVFEFPGEDHRNVSTPPASHRAQATDAGPVLAPGAEGHDKVADGATKLDMSGEWEDLGEGLMVYCKNNASNAQSGNLQKHEQSVLSSPSTLSTEPQAYVTMSMAHGGQSFARAAYSVVEEEMEMHDYEVVERSRGTEQYLGNVEPHLPSHEPVPRILHRMGPMNIPKFQEYRHKHNDDEDESIFRSRYAILNPRYRYY